MRLIDADTIQWTANGCGYPNCKDICDYTKDDGTCCGWLVAHKKDVDNLPTVDAVPVVHGHWEASNDRTFLSPCFQCSICGRKINTFGDPIKTAPYCHCGAKMDGEGETD